MYKKYMYKFWGKGEQNPLIPQTEYLGTCYCVWVCVCFNIDTIQGCLGNEVQLICEASKPLAHDYYKSDVAY